MAYLILAKWSESFDFMHPSREKDNEGVRTEEKSRRAILKRPSPTLQALNAGTILYGTD